MLMKSSLALALGVAAIPGYFTLLANPSSHANPVALPAELAADTQAQFGQGNHRGARYEVSITNLTRGQIFSPPVVAIHNGRLDPLFTLGEKASMVLAGVAEDAINKPLVDKLSNSHNVLDVKEIFGINGPILPGETATVTLAGNPHWFNKISLVSMLVITNDAFCGLNGARLPHSGARQYQSPAYDAGSETNNESCDYIPGPPCNNPMKRDTSMAEGYVHIHAGIHGIGDLSPSMYDWRNNVAQIKVRRIW